VIVALVREQREWLISRFAQGVKTRRWSEPLQTFLERRYPRETVDYHRRFAELAGGVQHGNIVVRLFERDRLRDGDARSEVLGLAGTDVSDLLDDEKDTNASASLVEIEALRRINARPAAEAPRGRGFLRRARAYSHKMGWQPATDLYRLV